MLRDLDTRDSTILKGLAICAIVLHNYFHFISPAHQNEFNFDPQRLGVFLRTVRDPALSIQAFFSFFGHFGVQVFVFLSAFGLAKSHWNDTDSWAKFMWGRITKLYPLFALIVVPWSVAAAVLLGPFHFLRQFGLQFLLMFLGLSPFCGYDLPPVGPWWFIPFIIEFYAIWPLLRWLTSRFGWPALVLLSVAGLVLTYTLDPILAPRLVNLLETPIGRLPVLCFGIFAARYPVRISFPVAACSAALVLLGSRYQVMWLLTPLAVLLVILWSYVFLRDRLRNSNFLLRLGEYSLLTFLVNGIVRNQFLRFPTLPESQIVWGLVSACVSFFIAGIVHEWIRPRRQRVRIFEPVPSEAVEVVS